MSPPRNPQMLFQQQQMVNGAAAFNPQPRSNMQPQLQQQHSFDLGIDSTDYNKSASLFHPNDDSLHIDTAIYDFRISDGRFDLDCEETRTLVQQMLS
jgi:hypothetical protein